MNSKILLLGACLGSLLLTLAPSARAQGLTFSATNYYTGSLPNSIAVADVNGDGHPDVISANFSAGTLTVLTNNGGGIFGFNASYTVSMSANPFFVTAADINGDSKPDLICANYTNNAGSLTILTNNGKGGFVISASLNAAVAGPYCVAVADVNGDGKPDLICANNSGNYLTVFLNNGSGTFSPNATIGVGNGLEYVVAADVNGDGKPDLITANNTDGTLTVLTNNGAGAFTTSTTLNVGAGPNWLATADVNGDGKPDLISANNAGNSLTILTNSGFGKFGSNAIINLASAPISLIAADLNGDGKPDLACTVANNAVLIYTNNGSGIFGSNTTLNFLIPQKSLVTADVNGDGLADLLTANFNPYTVTVLTQAGLSRPILKISHPGTTTYGISWVSSSTGFILQTNNNLATTNWLPANLTVNTSNGTNQSTTLSPAPPGKLFFRLKQ